MKTKAIQIAKRYILNPVVTVIKTAIKPFAIALSFSFALGRAYERVNVMNKGGRYTYNY